ncbi:MULTISPECIES: ornithine carbamoyltransferase [unclassified Planococcus (in: firmicutes)]|uniref:ornithine carbamoyltransferase n=1 Tax=unclassified Planococcus (in: firmicutes) TaxID=2662419 RepID=UPI000C3209B6|nr:MULTISPECIES: ornithine carbamoyltransferase [unclassified Planococcus (in: firmicutes)]MDE4085159.1 ornithine carbamoyltransferase [Planococcus maritimus]AUD12562.1 ornithine carbamoyltransferase [Planococcus sp. MB-3u-03]PKG44418.1 ornithine carbamoyltransferase [Planococcus sp. Urea-trap-24]PKG91231.1 ornithine carbamoyltransferase [Planococcus sp. Urea-3u-39]PKH39570.1 ornithine carbamoyltransferase [Planococcus sp. MB-3u-09]
MTMIMPLAPTVAQEDFLSLKDYSTEEIIDLLNLAIELKKPENKHLPLLKGKVLGMIFEKSSTRTRVSFEAGMLQLGGHAMFLSSQDTQLGRGETIADTARVLSGYLDGLMIRTFHQSAVEELAQFSSIPVINGLTDDYHPCQVLADLMTLIEHFGELKGRKLAYIGDGNNMANSLMIGAAKVGLDIAIAAPKGYEPQAEMVELAQAIAKDTGSVVTVTHDPIEAVKNSDAIYTDVWASMGQEAEAIKRLNDFEGFQVNADLVQHAKADYIFMHCLPAHREEEVTTDILEGPHSVIFQEAENRLHAQKAVLVTLMGD